MAFISINKTYLPPSNYVEPEKISRMLDKNSASYKFYWFLAILEKCKESSNNFIFNIKDLIMDMLYYSYWTVNECHLYLGFQDKLEMTSKYIFENYKIKTNVKKNEFFEFLIDIGKYDEIKNDVYNIIKNHVIYRLLSPFIYDKDDKKIISCEINAKCINFLADEKNVKIPYKFVDNYTKIYLDEDYIIYFIKHYEILKNFILYKLSEYFQKKNPSVPGIINKLQPLFEREALTKQRKMYKCIYEISTNKEIDINIYNDAPIKEHILNNNYELDHYIPFSYCFHNEWWNLTPTTNNINGVNQKGNKIPDNTFLSKLIKQQYYICKEIQNNNFLFDKFVKANLIDDRVMYELYIKKDISMEKFNNALSDTINPMITIALKQGFKKWAI